MVSVDRVRFVTSCGNKKIKFEFYQLYVEVVGNSLCDVYRITVVSTSSIVRFGFILLV